MAKTTAVATVEDPREVALLKAVGLDKLAPEQRELALHIAKRYDLDLMLKHLVMIDGRPYITRDGLLHIAHRSGQLDGIETTEPAIVDEFWRCSASVYRKDMTRPFTYGGRYPTKGGNQRFAPEMALKVAESMALRRAFDVAAPVAEERWDLEMVGESASAAAPSLAERAAAKAAEVVQNNGLSKSQFMAALSQYDIPQTVAQTVRMELFPDATYELNDADRQRLLDELLRGLDEADMDAAVEAVAPGQTAAFDEEQELDAVALATFPDDIGAK